MNVFLKSLSLTNGTLSPAFNPNVYEYYFYLNGSNDTTVISASTEQGIEVIQIEYFETREVLVNGLSPVSTPEIVIQGLQNFRVIVGIGGSQTVYRVKVSLSKGKWPIHSDTLDPGMYGGSYVPNYRMLKEIYTIGSGDKDYEGNYKLKEPLNEQSLDWLNSIINQYTSVGKLDAIVESFIHYSGFINTNWPDDGDYRYYLPLIEVGINRELKMDGGFIPKNNKLFAFPFSSLKIIGYGGESELKYELFPKNIRFGIVSKFFAGSSIELYPTNYSGILDDFEDGVVGQPLPIFPYTKDAYLNEYNASLNTRSQAVLAMEQNKNLAFITNGVNTISNSTQLAGSGLTKVIGGSDTGKLAGNLINNIGGQIGAIGTGIVQNKAAELQYNQGLDKMFATLQDVENRPSSIANQNASPSIPAVMKDAVVPFVQRCSIREVFARRIDEFFTRYGYKVNKFKEVNIHTRPVFNFLKCSQARVEGSIPQEDLIAIKNILEKGITFWHDPSKIYDYTVDNPAPIKNRPVYNKSV